MNSHTIHSRLALETNRLRKIIFQEMAVEVGGETGVTEGVIVRV